MLKCNDISFEQNLDPDVLAQCVKTMKACDLIFVVGTSAVVSPARELPMLAKVHGAKVIVINPERTTHSDCADVTVLSKGSVLQAILQSIS